MHKYAYYFKDAKISKQLHVNHTALGQQIKFYYYFIIFIVLPIAYWSTNNFEVPERLSVFHRQTAYTSHVNLINW